MFLCEFSIKQRQAFLIVTQMVLVELLTSAVVVILSEERLIIGQVLILFMETSFVL